MFFWQHIKVLDVYKSFLKVIVRWSRHFMLFFLCSQMYSKKCLLNFLLCSSTTTSRRSLCQSADLKIVITCSSDHHIHSGCLLHHHHHHHHRHHHNHHHHLHRFPVKKLIFLLHAFFLSSLCFITSVRKKFHHLFE